MKLDAQIQHISSYLPEKVRTNEELAQEFEGWTAEKILEKTGISKRHVAADNEFASDLAVLAAEKLFSEQEDHVRENIDFLLLCTQSPDYFLPTTACILQDRLGLSTKCGALDFNLGCSGYVYGLSLASALITSKQAKNVLLLTSDTYSKFISENDQSVKTLFGDGASATLLTGATSGGSIGPFLFGTDGSGAEKLIVREGGLRGPSKDKPSIRMSGPDIFAFTMNAVPKAIDQFLEHHGESLESIDLVVFHQANQFMLEHLRNKIGIPKNKFVISMRDVGNTVSSSIPIAIIDQVGRGALKRGDRVLLVGFGVGFSWGATVITW